MLTASLHIWWVEKTGRGWVGERQGRAADKEELEFRCNPSYKYVFKHFQDAAKHLKFPQILFQVLTYSVDARTNLPISKYSCKAHCIGQFLLVPLIKIF